MIFEKLYKLHYKSIYKFCFRFLNSHEKALDVVQEAFLKLYQQMNSGNYQIENPKAWLYKVSGNLCLNQIKRHSQQNYIIAQLDPSTTDQSNPESHFIENENRLRIRKAICSLKPQHQMLVLLYQDGLSYKELSEATGIPVNSIGKTLWRNIETISQTIKKADHE
jgi:RNA polymerase sigma factor (sigma-70 family)